MAIRQYTREQLLHLRSSPLVEKPDNLPAIEQWIEYVYADKDSNEKLRIHHSTPQNGQQNPRQTGHQSRRVQREDGSTADAAPMGSFGAGAQRPSLLQTRGMGSKTGDDVTLGPPKTVFSSSRHTPRISDFGDKAAVTGPEGDDPDAPRSRFFSERANNRKSYGDREGREGRETWSSRRTLDEDEVKERGDKFGRRDKEQNGDRRVGYGDRQDRQDRQDRRWGRGEDGKTNGDRQGDWRNRDRRNDRDLPRDQNEREPEWMDEPARKQEEDLGLGMPRTQEDFQKWKEAMNRNKKPAIQDDERLEEAQPSIESQAPMKAFGSLKIEGVADKPFGGWTEQKREASGDSAPAPAKTLAGKGKSSRFASMFAHPPPKDEPSPPQPAEVAPQNLLSAFVNGSSDDKEGFQRILQMLGGNGSTAAPQPIPAESPVAQPKSPQAKSASSKKSRFTGFFDQSPKSPERLQSPPQTGFQPQFGKLNGDQPAQTPALLQQSSGPQNGSRDQRPPSGRPLEHLFDAPPSRGASTPDFNVQNLVAGHRASGPQGPPNKDSQFLLGLLQSKSSGPPTSSSRPTSGQTRPDSSFQLWMDQSHTPETIAPKPRMPPGPPGLFEDQLLKNAPHEPPQQQMLQPQQRQEAPQSQPQIGFMGVRPPVIGPSRNGPPPGFGNDESQPQPFYMQPQQQQLRRNFTEPPQQQPQLPQQIPQPNRRISGHPGGVLPPGMVPPGPQHQPQFPPDFPFLNSPPGMQPPPVGPQRNLHQPPPPGLPGVRHPPGFNSIPNIFQQPQHHPPPPGFGGAGGIGPGLTSPGGLGNAGPPPGFFPPPQQGGGPPLPPGYMPLRSPVGGGAGFDAPGLPPGSVQRR
ncbi:hypothetical protein K431DRAFT_305523 [Polychaeton citri CBS 116435]|uniref:Uncharacterized protein n=1 Tax=Polychaeton citri CBS 116435 TaxID=1314669 RepID=A0A9P4UN62_9PEZI|nr:hypothetical protein K431DRAFT_305523 [Polychaeton citri CBS 116435]